MHLLDEPYTGSGIPLSTTGPERRQPFEVPGHGAPNPSGAATCLGVVDEYPFTRECISSCLKLARHDLTVLTFSSIEDCMMESAVNLDLILFHLHSASAEQSDWTVASLKSAFESFPVIILSDLENSEWVFESLENGARGYIPTGSTSVAVAVEVIRLVRAGGTFVPPTSLRMMQHPLSPPGPLTSRQVAVLHHMTQGKSNKVIARALGMSESTVKVHVRGIMKKLQATNRTEAVFRARTLYSARPRPLAAPVHPKGRVGTAKMIESRTPR